MMKFYTKIFAFVLKEIGKAASFGTRKSQVQILPPRPPSNKIGGTEILTARVSARKANKRETNSGSVFAGVYWQRTTEAPVPPGRPPAWIRTTELDKILKARNLLILKSR